MCVYGILCHACAVAEESHKRNFGFETLSHIFVEDGFRTLRVPLQPLDRPGVKCPGPGYRRDGTTWAFLIEWGMILAMHP